MLEMVSPDVTPERGVDGYEHDRTQGPACAIACGAGTIYRNYFVPIDGATGQTATRQLNGLADLAAALGRRHRDAQRLRAADALRSCRRSQHSCTDADEATRDRLMGHLRVGVQWDTEVTLADAGHTVTQVYCSALPVAYTSIPADGVGTVRALGARRRVRGHVRRRGCQRRPDRQRRAVPHAARCRRLRQSGRVGARRDPAGAAPVRQRQPRRARRVVRVAPAGDRRDDRDGAAAGPTRCSRPLRISGDSAATRTCGASCRRRSPTHPEPGSAPELAALIARELRRLTGVDVVTTTETAVQIERYPTAGMSGGFVSPPTWRDRIIPLLTAVRCASRSRWRAARRGWRPAPPAPRRGRRGRA